MAVSSQHTAVSNNPVNREASGVRGNCSREPRAKS